jgi:hypothetical protein
MSEEGKDSTPRARLKRLLDAAGIKGIRLGPAGYQASYLGPYREWNLQLRLHEGWLMARVFICRMPAEEGTKRRLMEFMLTQNGRLCVAKYSLGPADICLDLEYREEHVNGEVLSNLAGLVTGILDDEYPKLFRIISGDETLRSLERAFRRSTVR